MNLRYKLATLGALALLVSACQTTDTVDTSAQETEMESAPAASTTPVVVQPTAEEQARMAAEALDRVVYFDFDQSTLTPATRSLMLQHAAYLRTVNNRIVLEGHADERGTREYNIALGERRANAVRDFLVLQGINASRIETVSYGEERPAVIGSNEASWSRNRRVEIRY